MVVEITNEQMEKFLQTEKELKYCKEKLTHLFKLSDSRLYKDYCKEFTHREWWDVVNEVQQVSAYTLEEINIDYHKLECENKKDYNIPDGYYSHHLDEYFKILNKLNPDYIVSKMETGLGCIDLIIHYNVIVDGEVKYQSVRDVYPLIEELYDECSCRILYPKDSDDFFIVRIYFR